MKVTTEKGEIIDLKKGIDCSIPLSNTNKSPIAWGVRPPVFEPVKNGNWIGLVKEGASVNFRNITFNPHGNGTHTECLGHVTSDIHSINQKLNSFFFEAVVISITPSKIGEDYVILPRDLAPLKSYKNIEALLIRTLPNSVDKKNFNYSNTNPAYIHSDCLSLINELKVQHLLLDLPSVDKEDDGGELKFHKGFWEVEQNPRYERTITELIFVPDEAKDGRYVLNLQVAPFENDASPSRPVLYKLQS